MESLQSALGNALGSAADDEVGSEANTLQTPSSQLSIMVSGDSPGESKEDLPSEPIRERDSFNTLEGACSAPKAMESPLTQANAVAEGAGLSSVMGEMTIQH